MIYISSSCIKNENIIDVLSFFKEKNFYNVELSGGTKNFPDLKDKLCKFLNENDFNVRLHNYFPPPEEDFVVNIASLDKKISEKSINHCLKAIELSKKVNSEKFSIHAGFLIDPKSKEIGVMNKLAEVEKFFDKEKAINKMIETYELLKNKDKNIKIYLENNVLAKKNFDRFKSNPLLLTDVQSYKELKKKFNFNLLLDLAHLKVSCRSLNLDFIQQANYLINETDYIHLSGNEGLDDTNDSILSDREIIYVLENNNLRNKTFTLEVYKDFSTILKDFEYLSDIIKN
tara:strand:+ start:28 stop:888 length:861 start_codon:yes stop_codon:yes gene_type:complete